MNVYNDGSLGTYGKIVKEGDKFFPEPCGRGFDFVCEILNIETDELSYVFRFIHSGIPKTITFPVAKLTPRDIGELANKGIDVNYKKFSCFLDVCSAECDEYYKKHKLVYTHSCIGWDYINKKMSFKSYGRIGDEPSKYMGAIDIKPAGTLEDELEDIRKYVIGHTALEAILAIGASAIVNGYIGSSLMLPTLLVHLYGDSSQGKTTAAQLAVSIAGSCNLHKTSLFMSWNGTANSIVTRLKGNNGMPVVFDEISKYNNKDMTQLVYTLSDGREKDRCNKDATLKKVSKYDSWQTTIISTGEASLLSKCNNNTGLKMRVIEIDSKFTASAKHAEDVKKAVSQNYGHIAPELADAINKLGKDKIVAMHSKYKEMYIEKSTITKLAERTAANMAVILTAAELLRTTFNLNLNIDGIIDFLVKNEEENNSERDIADEAYQKIVDYVHENKNRFVHTYKRLSDNQTGSRLSYDKGEVDVQNGECWGRIEPDITVNGVHIDEQITILFDRFEKIVKLLGYEDLKVILKKLKEKGYLDCEEGKTYRKRKISRQSAVASKVIVINVTDSSEEAEADEGSTAVQQPQSKSETVIIDFGDDDDEEETRAFLESDDDSD